MGSPINRLRIRQQNVNKSLTAQLEVINTIRTEEYDIIALQEPYIDFNHLSRAGRNWITVYPGAHQDPSKVRSLMLISTQLSTNTWTAIETKSTDVTAIEMLSEEGPITIINIYNDCGHDKAINEAQRIISRRTTTKTSFLLLGDFNRHHEAWDNPSHHHLFTTVNRRAAQGLIDLIQRNTLQILLPPGTLTLRHFVSKNESCPDQVLGSPDLEHRLVKCTTIPEETPSRTDHYPISTTFELTISTSQPAEKRNYRKTDWAEFKKALEEELGKSKAPTDIPDGQALEQQLSLIKSALKTAERKTVPLLRPSKYMKRWWNDRLTDLVKAKRRAMRASHRHQHCPNHPAHHAAKEARQLFEREMEKAKRECWLTFLEEADGRTVYTANKYTAGTPTDGGKTRVVNIKHPEDKTDTSPATTNKEKAAVFMRTFFRPAPAGPKEKGRRKTTYPRQAFEAKELTQEQLEKQIRRLSPYKAAGPDGIPNIVYKQCANLLIPRLLPLYRASLQLPYYPRAWKESRTVILRKPGRTDYTTSKSYRPIALLNTDAKLLSACIAETLTHAATALELLPRNHFGGLPGRTTTDAIHYLIARIRTAQRRKQCIAILFLDIQSAFPSTDIHELLHDLQKAGIPKLYIKWLDAKFKGRNTSLTFDDFVSEPYKVETGLDQGCPLSPILYLYYNAGLLQTTEGTDEDSLAFIDDAACLAIDPTIEGALQKLQDIYMREEGVQQWAETHSSIIESDKSACIIYSNDPIDPKKHTLTLQGHRIHPAKEHKYLGITLDANLSWRTHTNIITGKGTRLVGQLRRLSKTTGGIPPKYMRILYNTVVVPKILYAADCFLAPFDKTDLRSIVDRRKGIQSTRTRLKGSVSASNKLASVQRQMALAITGSYRSTPTDFIDFHAALLPFRLLINKVCLRAALRLFSLPDAHPLHPWIKSTKRRNIRRRLTPLHRLKQAFDIDTNTLETIPINKRDPSLPPAIRPIISKGREAAIAYDKHLNETIRIYTDGSAKTEGVGAAAILIREGRKRKLTYHLGKQDEHTVYEAELVGLILVLHLLQSEKRVRTVRVRTATTAEPKSGLPPTPKTRVNKRSSDSAR